MKKWILFLSLVLGLTMPSIAEEQMPADMSPEDAAMMEKFKEFATPGENHRVLDALVGDWGYEIKMWKSPDAKPEISSGTTTTAWILDGHFIQQKTLGTAMNQPFEGMGLVGYDNLKKKYNTVWADSMGTGMMVGSGKYDSATQTLTEEGDFTCPMVEGNRSFKAVTKIVDPEHYTYDMYMQDEVGKEFLAMQISYTRRK